VETATGLGIKTEAQLTDMNAPIGTHLGNALEVMESIEVMQGRGSVDTRELVVLQGTALLTMTMEIRAEEAEQRMRTVLNNGAALDVFEAMCVQQGVDPSVAAALVTDPQSVLGQAPHQTTILATETGHVGSFQTMAMAQFARSHGAGRFHLDDAIDPLVGFVLHRTMGSPVTENDPVLTFHHTRPLEDDEMSTLVQFVSVGSPSSRPPTRLVERIQSSLTKP
jgi:pyrimidine-nucleoside phosphorylase